MAKLCLVFGMEGVMKDLIIDILKAVIVVYCLCIAPYMLGHIIRSASGREGGNPCDTYVKGYVAYLAAFGFLSYMLYNRIWKLGKER